jgi:hypothetical protein
MNEVEKPFENKVVGERAVDDAATQPRQAPLQPPEPLSEELPDGCDETNAMFSRFRAVAEACAATYAPQPGEPTTWISLGLLVSYVTLAYQIALSRLVDFINALGAATVTAGLLDVQFALAKRQGKGPKDLDALYGVIVDVDRPTTDILGEVERAGVPMPTFTFPTINGFKLAYATTQAVPLEVFREIAMSLTLALEGGDATSWEPAQMQRLPQCLKSTPDAGVVPVNVSATLTNAVPFNAKPGAVPFPFRGLTALACGLLGAADRGTIREYLEDRGTPAPDECGSALYDRCPITDVHDSRCCYVNVAADGEISAHCLGGHDGEGEKHWGESQLAALAGVATGANRVERFDPLRHLPVTRAAVQYIRFRLVSWQTPYVDAFVQLWMREWARREAQRLSEMWETDVDPNLISDVHRQRLDGVHGLPPMISYYERAAGKLVHDDPSGRALPVTSKQGPNLKANAIELKSTGLWTLMPVFVRGVLAGFESGWCTDAVSLLHTAAVGHAHVLARYGVAAMTTYALPVAHVGESWAIHPGTFHIEAVTVRQTFLDVEEVEALGFFVELWSAGRLPLATENDVKLFVMLLATPLLRHIAPGQLGVTWFVGPPGSGKDFLAEMARIIWEACGPGHARVSFEINLAGDLELKRSLEMAAGCIFARAKEAGKRPGMAESLIRLAGTDTFSVRGLYKDEVTVSNTFTFVAESSEDLPDRREISRRTTIITVSFMSESNPKGEVLENVRANSKGIIKNLQRLVESQPRDWYLLQTDTGSRPLVPVALARLLGATLPAVEGEDLAEVYEAMVAFIESSEGKEEGPRQLAIMKNRSDKVSFEAKSLPSHRLAFFIDTMAQKPGNAELFSPYARKSRELVNRIKRESEYRTAVSEHGYMPVDVRGKRYALRLEDGRRFILVPQLEYLTKLKDAREAATRTPSAEPPAPAAVPAETSEPDAPSLGASADAPTFQEDDALLLKKSVP